MSLRAGEDKRILVRNEERDLLLPCMGTEVPAERKLSSSYGAVEWCETVTELPKIQELSFFRISRMTDILIQHFKRETLWSLFFFFFCFVGLSPGSGEPEGATSEGNHVD